MSETNFDNISHKKMKQLKGITKNFLYFFISFFIFLAILEFFLRLVGGILLLRNPYNIKKDSAIKIFCYGDSFTYGLFVKSCESYPSQLAKMLTNGGRGIKVINRGVPGCGSSLVLAKIKEDIKIYQPNCIVILVGMNDVLNAMDIGYKYTSLSYRIKNFLVKLRICKLLKITLLNLREKFLNDTIKKGYLLEVTPADNQIQYVKCEGIPYSTKIFLINRGIDYYNQGKYKCAIGDFNKILELNAEDGDALLWIGATYKKLYAKNLPSSFFNYLLPTLEYLQTPYHYKKNIISIIKIAQNFNTKVILLKYPNWSLFDRIIDEIGSVYNISVVDTKKGISDYLIPKNYFNYFMKDHHPKKKVYFHIAKLVYKKLKEIQIINE